MNSRPGLAELLEHHRALVCVGTGGVGKTTIAAALGVAAARRGKRVMVLTIDPARQLARALGLASLERHGERVDLSGLSGGAPREGSLHAAMLDQKGAWDAFITRHAPTPELRDTLLENPFYQQLSGSLAGSMEYMAIEELCFLEQSGDYDLIVVDTPPASHAVEFLQAPRRIERLLDPKVAHWLSRPYAQLGRGAFRAMSATVRLVVATLERMAGTHTLRQISAFFAALEALLDDVAGRAARARALLGSERTAFVLVSAPSEGLLQDGEGLLSLLDGLQISLRGAVLNRVHPLPEAIRDPGAVERALGEAAGEGGGEAAVAWLREAHRQARAVYTTERAHMQAFASRIPAGAAWAEVPELERDAHSLRDLQGIAAAMGAIE